MVDPEVLSAIFQLNHIYVHILNDFPDGRAYKVLAFHLLFLLFKSILFTGYNKYMTYTNTTFVYSKKSKPKPI